MKLMEITPITADKMKPRPTTGDDETGKRLYKGVEDAETHLGSGHFASAYATPTEPGTVRKIVHNVHDLKADAYFSYVNMINKNQRMQSNRFFPKIFDVQVYKNQKKGDEHSDPVYEYSVDMERLYDWMKLTDKEALMIGKQLFHDFKGLVAPSHQEKKRSQSIPNDGKAPIKPYRDLLMQLMRSTFSGWSKREGLRRSSIKDPHFKQALMLIRNLRDKDRHGMFTDIHDGNIMFRRGKHGPQLVFNDPVAS